MAFQELMIAPTAARSFSEGLRLAAEVYHALKAIIAERFGALGELADLPCQDKVCLTYSSATGLGDEGGFAPPITSLEHGLDLLTAAVEKAGHTGRIKFACDPASSEFYDKNSGMYDLSFKDDSINDVRTSKEMQQLYKDIIGKYPLVLLEDPFAEDDWQSWTEFNHECKIELVGDDLLCTNVERIKVAAEEHACNAVLLKLNQIGTVSEAIAA